MVWQNIQFINWLILLPLMIVIFVWYKKTKQGQLSKIGNPQQIKTMLYKYSWLRQWIALSLLAIVVGLLIIAIANPSKATNTNTKRQGGKDVIICLDVSNSMLATDVAPSRLDKAKQLTLQLMAQQPNNNYGLILFAGKAYTSVPLTPDASAIALNIEAASPDMLPIQGTNITDALKAGYNSFNQEVPSSKAIILITDGEHHEQSIDEVLDACIAKQILVIPVGVGTEQGGQIIDPQFNQPKNNDKGEPIVTQLNTSMLASLSTANNGEYYLLNSIDGTLSDIINALSALANNKASASKYIQYKYYYQYLIWPALILLLFYFLLPIIKNNKPNVMAAITILLIAFSQNTIAQSAEAYINKGNLQYNNKQYDSASKNYSQASKNNYTSADNQFKAYYNLGNAMAKQKQYQQACDAYVKALKIKPGEPDAQYNLIYCKQKLQQQQQQQQKNQQQKNQQQQNKDKQNPNSQQDNQKQQPTNPKPSNANISKAQAEQILKSLAEQEKKLLQQQKGKGPSSNQILKDW
jgi:tetratricopeptide (TPR) repeat protein